MAKSIINGTGQLGSLPSRGISILGTMKVYDTYPELLLDKQKSAFAWVDDASGDPTVNEGGALYRIKDGLLIKMMETESMDQIFGADVPWAKLLNKPESSVIDIDDAVEQRHSHDNKDVLDQFSKPDKDLKIGDATVITNKNLIEHVGNGTAHVHSNYDLLQTIHVNEDGSVRVGETKVVTETTLEKLKVTNVVRNIGAIPEGQDTVTFDLNDGNYFILEGAQDYIVPTFSGDVSNVSGTIVVRGGTPVLWPKGNDENGFYWIWGDIPQDISNNPNTDIIVLDYRIVDKAIFINEVCSKIGEV